ncbi:alpha-ketoglutarate-dependent dioxygenase AlkB family protein [Haloferula chungangensis]|uniref:Alpha-ketoglutarate-dependent dioxygenase AlkB family protein n=1 Tax=Haloferula chungangensis TaxID=1048331 RepID=A0ABW2L715_9BACT
MDLFSREPSANLLPRDGEVIYFGPILDASDHENHLQTLLESVPWESDELVMFGRRVTTSRKVAWYGDRPFAYKYSGSEKVALAWTSLLQDLKRRVEDLSGERFNSCLLNLYHDGSEGMGWHRDDESAIVRDSAIGSLSFGAERKFSFKHAETKEGVSLVLEKGSLLVMKGETQRHWLHALPKTKKSNEPRVNLTFRRMKE